MGGCASRGGGIVVAGKMEGCGSRRDGRVWKQRRWDDEGAREMGGYGIRDGRMWE